MNTRGYHSSERRLQRLGTLSGCRERRTLDKFGAYPAFKPRREEVIPDSAASEILLRVPFSGNPLCASYPWRCDMPKRKKRSWPVWVFFVILPGSCIGLMMSSDPPDPETQARQEAETRARSEAEQAEQAEAATHC